MTFDVSALKLAKMDLERSETRLRAITDNLPVMISYIDREERLQFLNRTFQDWTGIPIAVALGQPLRDVIGDTLYDERAGAMRAALRGERVAFDVESQALGVRRCLQTVYIPDVSPADRVEGIYTLTTDVTALRDAERRMADLALHDSLTGLANRRRLDDALPEALARARRSRQGTALLFLDVDHFKQVNDRWGHAAGDQVLVEFAARLRAAVRGTDLVARLAGDEFVIILEGLNASDEATLVAEKISASLRQPFELEGGPLPVSSSIGVAYLAPGRRADPQALLNLADEALYATKQGGRDGHTCYQVGEDRRVPA